MFFFFLLNCFHSFTISSLFTYIENDFQDIVKEKGFGGELEELISQPLIDTDANWKVRVTLCHTVRHRLLNVAMLMEDI